MVLIIQQDETNKLHCLGEISSQNCSSLLRINRFVFFFTSLFLVVEACVDESQKHNVSLSQVALYVRCWIVQKFVKFLCCLDIDVAT